MQSSFLAEAARHNSAPSERLQRGAEARAQRIRRKLTLDAVSALSGLSKGHISRFERGEKSLSVESLMRLARALNTSVATLLGERVDDNAVHMMRRVERPTFETPLAYDGCQSTRLSSPEGSNGLEVIVVEIGEESMMDRPHRHAGEEVFFVLEGAVELDLVDRAVKLSKGDFLQLSGSLTHRLRGVEERNSVLILTVSGRTKVHSGP
jgi:transcriptional regulator with XRE-family HTH domain